MRLGLIQGLLNTVVHNQKRQQPRVRLFEYGLRFIPCESAENGMRQEPMLAGVIAGTRAEEHWDIETNTVDFFDLKGDLEAVLELTSNEIAYSFEPVSHPALHRVNQQRLLLMANLLVLLVRFTLSLSVSLA